MPKITCLALDSAARPAGASASGSEHRLAARARSSLTDSALPFVADRRRDQVHRRRAHEVGDEHVGRVVVDLGRRAELLHARRPCITAILVASVIASIWSWVT